MTGQLSTENLGVRIDPNTNADHKSSFQKRIRRVLNRQENKICLDCSRPGPRWASIISVTRPSSDHLTSNPFQEGNHSNRHPLNRKHYNPNDDPQDENRVSSFFGGFCCLECSGAHRTLGTHLNFVRSVDFDSLTEREVRTLETTGNAVVNDIFEGRLFSTAVGGRGIAISFTKEIKPDASSDQNTRELFIRNKYDKKMYLDVVALNKYHHHSLALSTSFSDGEGDGAMDDIANLVVTPSSSGDNQSVDPPQLQIFTSSPRTLAMLEKYMNPKPKKKKLSKRIRYALGMKKNTSEVFSVPAASKETGPIIISNMPTSLKTIQTRSNEETIDEYSTYSDSEYNIELVKRKGSSLVDLQEESSITSAKSTMSGTTRRSRWAIPRHKKRKYSKRKNKDHKKYRSLKGLNNNSKDAVEDSDTIDCNFAINTVESHDADGGGVRRKRGNDEVRSSSTVLPDQTKLEIVEEDSSSQSKYLRSSSREEDDRSREEEISLMALWSRGMEWAMRKRFKSQSQPAD